MAAAVYESRPPLRRTTASDTARGRAPDVLVELQLDAHPQPVGEYPLRERLRLEHTVHRREVNGGGTVGQVVPGDDVLGVVVVAAILDDELHLVLRAQPIEVRPVHLVGLAA